MLILVTYDVNVVQREGRRRLRRIAKTCLDYGVRVQNSVFECEVDSAQLVVLKSKLKDIFNPEQDSLRFYFLGRKGHQKVEHLGAKSVPDSLRDPLIF
jgi:CRISPR-associated protein Cas2